MLWSWTDNDRIQWQQHARGTDVLFSAWVSIAIQAFAEESAFHAHTPAGADPSEWFRGQMEQYRPFFCGSPTDPEVREASRRVGFAHIQAHVLPSWYVSLYNLIFDAYHVLESEGTPVPLPPLDLVRRRWLADMKSSLDTYEVAMSSKMAALHDLALTDPLTGLLNRRGFWDRVALDIERGVHQAVFVLMDIDHFKRLNDHHGHPFGDRVLAQFATLAEVLSATADALGRLGGDEFGLWIPNAEGPGAVSQRLQTLAETLMVDSQATFSGGIATFPHHGKTVEHLYHEADGALYQAKQAGRHCYAVAGETQPYPF